MNAPHQQVAERLTRYYLTALSIIAALSLSGLWLVRNAIRYHEADSRVLNIAGRQRMLSQNLVKLALLRGGAAAPGTAAPGTAVPGTAVPGTKSEEFDSLLHTWKEKHYELERGLLKMDENYLVKKSRALSARFEEIGPVFRKLHQAFGRYNRADITEDERKQLLDTILVNERAFLRLMDEIVFQFDAESRKRVEDLEIIELIMATISLMTLLMEALLVFRPVVRYTREIIRELTESREALRLSNLQLQEANRHLYESQQELIKLNEIRLREQQMEDQIRSAALMEGQEEERRRLARELHDGVGQMLTGLNLLMARLRKTPYEDPRYKARLDEISASVQEIIKATRQVSHNVMPDSLVDYGIGPALQGLTDQMKLTAASEVELERSGVERRLHPSEEIGLYRIAQEGLTNALKHSKAAHIRIVLIFEPSRLTMTVEDNGRGFDREKVLSWQNLGLENMQTRAKLIKAEFLLDSIPQRGTRITVMLPLT